MNADMPIQPHRGIRVTRTLLLVALGVSFATIFSLSALIHSGRPHSALPLDPHRAARLRRGLNNHPIGTPEFPMDGALARVPGVSVLGHDTARATLRRCSHSGALAPRGLRFLVLTPTDCKVRTAGQSTPRPRRFIYPSVSFVSSQGGPLPGWLAHPKRVYDVFLMDHSANNTCRGGGCFHRCSLRLSGHPSLSLVHRGYCWRGSVFRRLVVRGQRCSRCRRSER